MISVKKFLEDFKKFLEDYGNLNNIDDGRHSHFKTIFYGSLFAIFLAAFIPFPNPLKYTPKINIIHLFLILFQSLY
jgi:hypothetical protein